MSIWENRILIVGKKTSYRVPFFGKLLWDTCYMILTCNVKRYAMKMKKWILEQLLSSMSTNVHNCTDVNWIKSTVSQYCWVWCKMCINKVYKMSFLVFPPHYIQNYCFLLFLKTWALQNKVMPFITEQNGSFLAI